MPDCYMCLPTCENCKPKMVLCQECGMKTLMDLPICPRCKTLISDEARSQAWDDWHAKHDVKK